MDRCGGAAQIEPRKVRREGVEVELSSAGLKISILDYHQDAVVLTCEDLAALGLGTMGKRLAPSDGEG